MRRIAKIAFINILTAAAVLLLLETGSRVLKPVGLPDPLITNRKEQWLDVRRPDPYLFWTMRPHAEWKGGRLNSLGLRGPEIPSKKPDEFRVLSLGESTTFGVGVLPEETYSNLLENEMPFVDGKRLQVINAGSPGYTLFQGLTYLRINGVDLHPDAVMVYFGYNDSIKIAFRSRRDAGFRLENAGLTDRQLHDQRKTLGYALVHYLQHHSNLVRVISFRSQPTSEEVIVDTKQPRVPDEDRRWVLKELREMSRIYGFRLIVVIPWYLEFNNHIKILRELSEWNEVTLVDLPEKFENLPQSSEFYFHDKVHPNSAGHRLIAEAIGAELRSSWGLTAGGPGG